MNNKEENLFSIGEVCRILGITRRILLNYETLGLIQPDKKNGSNGNRFYTLDTITHIRIIRLFQNYGLSLKEIKDYFSGTLELSSVIHRLEELRDELDQNIKNLSAYVDTSTNEIVEVSIPAQTLYCRTISCSNIMEKTNFLRDTALFALNKYGTDFSKRQYATEYTLENPDETTFCISVPENSTGEGIIHLPSSRGISVNHHGCYEELHTANKQLLEYAHAYNLSHSGRFRNVYLEGPPQHKNKNLFITQVILLF